MLKFNEYHCPISKLCPQKHETESFTQFTLYNEGTGLVGMITIILETVGSTAS